MNILEAFHFIFEADASNLKTGLQSAEKDNAKLKEGVEQTDKSALKLGETFLTLAKSAATLFAGVVSVGALTAMSAEVANQTNALATQAKQLNVNTSSLYDWQNAVVASGGTAEGFNSTLGNLLKSTRDPEKALLRMSDTFKRMSSYRAMKLGEAMGIDAGTAELLRKGRDGIKDLLAQQRELGTVDKRLIDVSARYQSSLRDTNRVYDDIKRQIAMVILPIMTKWLDILRGGMTWMRDNKPFVIGFFSAIAGIITAIYLPAMLRAVAATYALLAPYLLVGAAIAAVGAIIGLVVDDIWNFLEGNDSLVGELSKTWPWIGELIRAIADEIKYLWEVAKGLWEFLKLLFVDPAAAWQKFKDELSGGIDALINRFPALKGPIEELKRAFEMCANGVAGAWQAVIKVLDTILGMVGRVVDGVKGAFDKVKSWFGDAEEKGEAVQKQLASGEKKSYPGQREAPEEPSEANGFGSQLGGKPSQEVPTPENTGPGVVNPWANDPSGRGYNPYKDVADRQVDSGAPASHTETNDNSVTHNVHNVQNVAQTRGEAPVAAPAAVTVDAPIQASTPVTVEAPIQAPTPVTVEAPSVNVKSEAPAPMVAPVTAAAPVTVEAPTVNVKTEAPRIPQPTVAAPSPMAAPAAAPMTAPVAAPVTAPAPMVAPVTAPAPIAAPAATPAPMAAPVTVEAPTVNVKTEAPLIPQPPVQHSPISRPMAPSKPREARVPPPDRRPEQMTPKGQQQIAVVIDKAKQNVSQMSNAPINRQNSAAIAHAGRDKVSKKTEINVDTIEIQTQAQDAEGISRELEGSLQRQFSNASSDFDDGYSA